MEQTFNKTILDNGLRIVTETMPGLKSVAIGFWIGVGSRFEDAENNGISHLLEHMMFKGTTKRNSFDIAVALESLGGHLNAFTGKESTCYYAHLLARDLPMAVDVIADMLLNSRLDGEELEKEKQVIFEEIRNLDDTPDDLIHDRFLEQVFGHGNLGLPTLGSRESVSNISRLKLIDFKNTFYNSQNIIISAAGQVDHDTLVDLVSRVFQDVPTGTRQNPAEYQFQPETEVDHSTPTSQTHICVGSRGISYNDPRKYHLIFLNTLLGAGMSSRLFQHIREKKGLAYSVYSFIDLWSDTGLWGVYAGTSPKSEHKVLKSIDSILRNLAKTPISASELDQTRSQLTGHLLLSSEDSNSRMNRLAKMELLSQTYQPIEYAMKTIGEITPRDIQALAKNLFQDQHRYSTIIKPS